MIMRLLIFLLLSCGMACAYPDFERCNLATWVNGGPFNQLGIANYSDGGNADCVISGVPQTFTPCQIVVVTLTSKTSVGHKLAVSAGTLSNSLISTTKQKVDCRHSSTNKQTITNYRWTAPPDNTAVVSFGALCGDMLVNQILFAARQKVSSRANNGSLVEGSCPFDAIAENEQDVMNTAQALQENIPLMAGIGGVVVAGLGLAGLFAYKKRGGVPAERVVEKIEDFGNSVKQRIQSVRPPVMQMPSFSPTSNQGFNRMDESRMVPQQQGMYARTAGGNQGFPQMQAFPQMQVSPPSTSQQAWSNQGMMAAQRQQQYAYPLPGQYQGGGGQAYAAFSSGNPTYRQQY